MLPYSHNRQGHCNPPQATWFCTVVDVVSAMIVAGEPMDIPDGRWIDLRLDMPTDSIWNRKQAEYHELEKLTTFDGS